MTRTTRFNCSVLPSVHPSPGFTQSTRCPLTANSAIKPVAFVRGSGHRFLLTIVEGHVVSEPVYCFRQGSTLLHPFAYRGHRSERSEFRMALLHHPCIRECYQGRVRGRHREPRVTPWLAIPTLHPNLSQRGLVPPRPLGHDQFIPLAHPSTEAHHSLSG